MGMQGYERGYESDTRTSITKTLKDNIISLLFFQIIPVQRGILCTLKVLQSTQSSTAEFKLCQFKGEFYLTEDAKWPKNAENVQIFLSAGFIWLLYQ